jgi:hypothetical protein
MSEALMSTLLMLLSPKPERSMRERFLVRW